MYGISHMWNQQGASSVHPVVGRVKSIEIILGSDHDKQVRKVQNRGVGKTEEFWEMYLNLLCQLDVRNVLWLLEVQICSLFKKFGHLPSQSLWVPKASGLVDWSVDLDSIQTAWDSHILPVWSCSCIPVSLWLCHGFPRVHPVKGNRKM